MLAMTCLISFAENPRREAFELRQISKCSITTGWEDLTDMATLEIPRNIQWPKDPNGKSTTLKHWIRRGDQVEIQLGYDGNLRQEFIGYVSDVEADIPVKIHLQDLMWKLKQVQAAYSSRNAHLPTMMAEIIPDDLGITVDAADASIGAFRTTKGETVAQVLSRLKDAGIYSYFKGSTLVVGQIYLDDQGTVNYGFQDNIIKNNLKYQVADDVLIRVVATSTLTNGQKIEVEVGDEDGDVQKLSYFNIEDEATLRELALSDLARLRVDGYEGSLSTFGRPYVQHGYVASLNDNEYPDRAGDYYIDRVKTTWSSGGFRRKVTLGPLAS